MYKIGIIGHGFVGLAVETGLEYALKDLVDIRVYDKFKDTESLETVVTSSDILFICLPTPMNFDTGECKTDIIKNEIKNINQISKKNKIIIIKSTVPPGTTDLLQGKYPNHTFVFNPEFLTEKNFINDFLEQDRIILGVSNRNVHFNNVTKVRKLYEDFVKTQKQSGSIIVTQPKTAEMVKYIGNCFLMTKVLFFNEMYEICKAADISFDEAARIASLDKRIGSSHTQVPCNGDFGAGGSCFPKDINSLIYYAKELNVDPIVLETVWTKNLMVRQKYDWESLAQVSGEYKKNE